jgi:tetratricopeptide (TPR) repeat protein
MKKATSYLLLSIICSSLAAQHTVDSLRRLLTMAKEDTVKVNLLTRLSRSYAETKPDSNLLYAHRALELAKTINYEEGELKALLSSCAGFTLNGNYARALENGLEVLKRSERIGNEPLIARSYFTLAFIYSVQKDNKTSIPYSLKVLDIYKKLNDTVKMIDSYINTGVSYRELHMFDSARFFFNQALESSFRLKDEGSVSAVYLNLGIIALEIKQYDLGLSYCRLAIPYFKKNDNPLFLSSIYNVMGYLFDSTGKKDSAFYYSRLAYHYAKVMGAPQLLLFSTSQLAAFFKKNGNFDSAFTYQETAANAKDSLTNLEKQRQVQTLTYNEQLRQDQIEKQKHDVAAARKRNLELAAIAIFIPIFLFTVILIGRKSVKSRTIEFLGVLALLFLFEFIVLFAHPYIGHWTHE